MTSSINKSGIHPSGHRILVKPEEVMKEENNVIALPEDVEERYALAQTTGIIQEVGKTAWMKEDFGNTAWAEAGDRVIFAKYGGLVLKGKDGIQYRLLNDEDIVAVVDNDVEVE